MLPDMSLAPDAREADLRSHAQFLSVHFGSKPHVVVHSNEFDQTSPPDELLQLFMPFDGVLGFWQLDGVEVLVARALPVVVVDLLEMPLPAEWRLLGYDRAEVEAALRSYLESAADEVDDILWAAWPGDQSRPEDVGAADVRAVYVDMTLALVMAGEFELPLPEATPVGMLTRNAGDPALGFEIHDARGAPLDAAMALRGLDGAEPALVGHPMITSAAAMPLAPRFVVRALYHDVDQSQFVPLLQGEVRLVNADTNEELLSVPLTATGLGVAILEVPIGPNGVDLSAAPNLFFRFVASDLPRQRGRSAVRWSGNWDTADGLGNCWRARDGSKGLIASWRGWSVGSEQEPIEFLIGYPVLLHLEAQDPTSASVWSRWLAARGVVVELRQGPPYELRDTFYVDLSSCVVGTAFDVRPGQPVSLRIPMRMSEEPGTQIDGGLGLLECSAAVGPEDRDFGTGFDLGLVGFDPSRGDEPQLIDWVVTRRSSCLGLFWLLLARCGALWFRGAATGLPSGQFLGIPELRFTAPSTRDGVCPVNEIQLAQNLMDDIGYVLHMYAHAVLFYLLGEPEQLVCPHTTSWPLANTVTHRYDAFIEGFAAALPLAFGYGVGIQHAGGLTPPMGREVANVVAMAFWQAITGPTPNANVHQSRLCINHAGTGTTLHLWDAHTNSPNNRTLHLAWGALLGPLLNLNTQASAAGQDHHGVRLWYQADVRTPPVQTYTSFAWPQQPDHPPSMAEWSSYAATIDPMEGLLRIASANAVVGVASTWRL